MSKQIEKVDVSYLFGNTLDRALDYEESVTRRTAIIKQMVFVGRGIKYYIYPDDSTQHHIPHVHIKGGGLDLSCSIETGEFLGGSVKSKIHKVIKSIIKENKGELMKVWNNLNKKRND